MIEALALVTPLDPLHGDGYGFWSGIGSGSPILVGVAVFWRHHNCHRPRCWRMAWHPNPDTGHPECKHHHPHSIARDGSVIPSVDVRRVAADLERERQAKERL